MGTSVLLTASPAQAAPDHVPLGTAETFAILAGTGITNTGPTSIIGDVGTHPTVAMTGFQWVTLTGTNHQNDSVSAEAKDDLVTAYDDAAGRPALDVPVELGGTTKFAGVYSHGTLEVTGTLTLDAQDDPTATFIFQTASTLVTAPGARVRLINGADPCRVVWKVGSSATFDTDTEFVGDVLALTSIQALTRSSFQGRLFARNGAVTLDTVTIANAPCGAAGAGSTGGSTDGTTGGSTDGATGGSTDDTSADAGGTEPATPLIRPPSPPASPSTPLTPASPSTPATPASPPRTPGASTPSAPPAAPPDLPQTGAEVVESIAVALDLLAFGALALAMGRRRQTTMSA